MDNEGHPEVLDTATGGAVVDLPKGTENRLMRSLSLLNSEILRPDKSEGSRLTSSGCFSGAFGTSAFIQTMGMRERSTTVEVAY